MEIGVLAGRSGLKCITKSVFLEGHVLPEGHTGAEILEEQVLKLTDKKKLRDEYKKHIML